MAWSERSNSNRLDTGRDRSRLFHRARVTAFALSFLALFIAALLLEEVSILSSLWRLAALLVILSITAWFVSLSFSFEVAVLLGLVYGLVWLVRYLERSPIAAVPVPWYVGFLALAVEIAVLVVILCGILWLHFRHSLRRR
jgi:cellulose synthase/poly-beta-1,6-N-acetylglucosamine synthase-like glycosyltransferase